MGDEVEDPAVAPVRRVDRVAGGVRWRLRIYVVIFVVSCVVIVVHLVRLGSAVAVPVAAGLLGGVVVGVGASRMSRLSWDETQAKVIGNIDALGAVILVAYLLLTSSAARCSRSGSHRRWSAPRGWPCSPG